MYSFIKNNLYLFIAFITVFWAIINNIPINEKTVTKYFFAQKDKNFITNQKNKVNLRNFNKYMLNTKRIIITLMLILHPIPTIHPK